MAETKLIRRETTIPQLPEDVVANILSRLPAKYVVQLKCVCKPWRSLISDPHFAKLQLADQSKNHSNHTILYLSDPVQAVDCKDSGDGCELDDHVCHLEYPAVMKKSPGFDGFLDRIIVQGSCNGLICVVFPDGCIFLWNPTIREARELPNNNGDFDEKDYRVLGLGYDFSIDDYKVLRARYPIRLANCEILALKSNIWLKVEKQEHETDIYMFFEYQGTFLRGALHWLVYKPGNIIVILVFDIVEEKFSELVELPESMDEETKKHGWKELKKSRDSLILFCRDFGCTYLDAWKLNEYGVKSSWTKVFSNICPIPRLGCIGDALHYTKTGKILFEHARNHMLRLPWYDPKENTWKTVDTPQINMSGIWGGKAIYVGSLVSLDWYRPINQ